MSGAVYLLCGATSLLCAGLLLRGFAKNHVRLLFWSGLCFLALTADNFLLYVDLMVFPDIDISFLRRSAALLGIMLLIFGLVWDSK
jgi:hypothetical protein